ncbi:MAG: class I SAM-dependent methyltransferase [Bryobacteraceae bacterium]
MAEPNPSVIFEALSAFQKSYALKGAIDLDLFTAIAEGTTSAAELARRCSASERGIRILCDYLVVTELLTKDGNDYGLPQNSARFLDHNSPAYTGGSAGFLMHPDYVRAYTDMAAVVRKGGTLLPEGGTVSYDNRVWIDFARSMGAMAGPCAAEIATGILPSMGTAPKRVLDLAAGHGLFGIAIAKQYPEAEIVACDWAAVLQVAEENAVKAGVSGRVTKLAGDAMEVDFGTDFDLVLITNFLHHFDPPVSEKLLRKVHAALAPGGHALTVEFVPNDDRITPPISAAFAGDAGIDTRRRRLYLCVS